MQTFIRNFIVFLVFPIIFILIVEVFLPANIFTFRPHEAVIFNTRIPHIGSFYPNKKIHMVNSVGDLCHHTKYTITKDEYWITDKIGFRNNNYIKNPDIIIIGDSFIYGTGTTQEMIIANQLSELLQKEYSVYAMNCSLGDFDFFLRTGIIEKPKMIIYSNVEISKPHPYKPYKDNIPSLYNKIIKSFFYSGVNSFFDRLLRFYSIKWMQARITNQKGFGTQSPINPQMFFAQGKHTRIFTQSDLEESLNAVNTHKKYCDSLGITYIYLPIPNKETVYFDLVPFNNQPSYLLLLDSILIRKDITTVHTIDLYNKYRSTNSELLYHYDDSHWNSNGISIIADTLAKKVRFLLGKNQ